MKALVLLLLSTGLAIAAPEVRKAERNVKPTVKEGFVTRTVQHEAELKDWITGVMNELHKAQESVREVDAKHVAALMDLGRAQERADTFQREVDGVVAARNAAVEEADKLRPYRDKYHKLKWGCSMLAAGLAVMLFLKLPIPPPMNFYVAGGLGVAVFAALWYFL